MAGRLTRSVKTGIILAVAMMVALPFIGMQVANMQILYQALQDRTRYSTDALARSISYNVQTFMQGVYDAALLLSKNPDVQDRGRAGQLLLRDAIIQMPSIRLIYIQDETGMQTLRSSGELANRADRWWFRQVSRNHEPFVSEAYVSVNNSELVASVFLPLERAGAFAGVLGVDFNLQSILNAAGVYWNRDITYLLLDSRGTALAGSDVRSNEFVNYIDGTKRTVVLDKNQHFSLDENGQIRTVTENIELSPVMRRIVSEAVDSRTNSFSFREGQDLLVCAYQPVMLPGESEPWSVIVFQKQTSVYSLVLLAVLLVALLGTCILVTYRLIDRLVLRHVIRLKQDMSRIAGGELDVRADASAGNEIGELAADINRMVESLRQHQRRLDENEQMAALGSLAAGVAHEINTPLGVGITTATWMRCREDEFRTLLLGGGMTKKDLVDHVNEMDESLELLTFNLERGAEIIRSFKQISVDQTRGTVETFGVAAYLNTIAVSLRHLLKQGGHEVVIRCDEALQLRCDPGMLSQIVTNLVVNSVRHGFADRSNGRITIDAERVGDRFRLQYADDGRGIPPDQLDQIFNLHYTTLRHAGGSGLGLSIVHNLTTGRLGGTISVSSEPGRGISFIIEFPTEFPTEIPADGGTP